MIVPGRAAGGEGVAEPEIKFGRDAVGDIGERRGPLVGRDHQVRIVHIAPPHLRRADDATGDDIVGDRQQRADETLVAALDRRRPLIGTGTGPQPARDKSALGADRHDQRVLDVLGFHQAQDLGTKILGALRPADAAAGDRAAPHVHALDARTVDEDFKGRPRFRQARNLFRIELEGEALAGQCGAVTVIVGAQRREYQREVGAQDPVLIGTAHCRHGIADALFNRIRLACRPRGGQLGIQPAFEQLPQLAGGFRHGD